jgi:hypothetical protein
MTNKDVDQTQNDERWDAFDWSWSGSANLWPGLILIFLGLVFLARNFLGYSLHNWWALFILIPALNNLAQSWRIYQRAGEFGRAARRHAFWGAILVVVSFALLFDLDFDLLWPAILVLAGLGMLLGGFGL